MLRSVASKVAWVGRTASMVFGLALVLALVFGVAAMALAAVPGDPFKLGQVNRIDDALTTLIGSRSGAMMAIDNDSTATNARALDLRVEPGRMPMAVNSATKVTNLNADKLDGIDSNDLIKRGRPGSATPQNLNFYSYFMVTTSGVRDFPFGWAKLQTTGVAGQFKVCGNLPGSILTFKYVVYVNGTRSTGTVSANNGCSQVFDAGSGGDFRVSVARAEIFGVPSDSFTNTSYGLYGFSQL